MNIKKVPWLKVIFSLPPSIGMSIIFYYGFNIATTSFIDGTLFYRTLELIDFSIVALSGACMAITMKSLVSDTWRHTLSICLIISLSIAMIVTMLLGHIPLVRQFTTLSWSIVTITTISFVGLWYAHSTKQLSTHINKRQVE